MSTGASDPRYAPPSAQVLDVPPTETVLAERGIRLLAVIVDTLVLAAVYFILTQIPAVGRLVQADTAASGASWMAFEPLAALFGFAIFLLVQAWLLLSRGQTVGKLCFKLRIERSDGGKPGAWHLFGLRYGIGYLTAVNPVAGAVYGLVDALLIYRDSRQCLHDSIADTRVVQL